MSGAGPSHRHRDASRFVPRRVRLWRSGRSDVKVPEPQRTGVRTDTAGRPLRRPRPACYGAATSWPGAYRPASSVPSMLRPRDWNGGSRLASPAARIVDLNPDDGGDRIAVVGDGRVSYLPATRVDLGVRHTGAAGACRYTRRASDSALYVTGPMLGRTMFRSGDGGRSWTGTPYDLGMERFALERMPKDTEMGWIGAFAILRDDTFQMSVIPSNHRKNDQAYWPARPTSAPPGRSNGWSCPSAIARWRPATVISSSWPTAPCC